MLGVPPAAAELRTRQLCSRSRLGTLHHPTYHVKRSPVRPDEEANASAVGVSNVARRNQTNGMRAGVLTGA